AIPIRLEGAAAAPAVEHRRVNDRFGELALAPDGKKFAFIARGDVFAASAKEPGDAARVTNTAAAESNLAWTPDRKSIVYCSDRDGTHHIYSYDFAAEKETQLTSGDGADAIPHVSPDGKSIAFQRNSRDLIVLDLATNQTKTVASGRFDRRPFLSARIFEWSPDS